MPRARLLPKNLLFPERINLFLHKQSITLPAAKRKRISTPVFSSDPAEGPEWPTAKRSRVKQMKKLSYTDNEIQQETDIPRRTQYTVYEASRHRVENNHSGLESRKRR